MRISAYVLILVVGVFLGMAACGANNDQPSPTVQPAQPENEVEAEAVETVSEPEAVKAVEQQVQATEQQTTQQATQQQQAVTPPVTPPETPPVEEKPSAFDNEKDKVSYFLGTSVGTSLMQQGYEVNMDPFVRGISDVLNANEPAMSQAEMEEVMGILQQQAMAKQQEMQAQQQAQAQVDGAKNIADGQAFLEKNKTNADVVSLPSGLQYKILRAGDGATPTLTDTVLAHYKGTLMDGTQFDSSYDRGEPASFPVQGVIAGWTEALQLMKVGAKWQLFIPGDLAYPMGRPGIPPSSLLIFEVELIEIQ